jgi:CheY-like chemotaxis protein
MNLSSLLSQFRKLQSSRRSVRDKAETGLAFERLLSDLFRQQGIVATAPFAISGEQIDGAFEHKGWTYLVEVKWQNKKQSTKALYAFQGKPDRRIEGTRGLFISMSGYYQTSIARFAQGRKPNTILWTGEHIEAVLEGKITIPEMVDLSVRHAAERSELLFPLDEALNERADRLFAVAIEASSAQVESEIFATVGRKFIPNLYIQRSVQQDIGKLIHPERELDGLLDELAKIGITPPQRFEPSGEQTSDRLLTFAWLMNMVRNRQGPIPLRSSLRLYLDVMPTNPMGRMHVITSRAGMGKTNLLCHLAKTYATQQPTVFLTGRSGITSTTPLKALIEAKVASHLRDPFPRDRCFDHLVSLAQARDTSLLVVIDALNEHRDFDLVNSSIAHFLNEVADLPVVILASCRDVYWPFFDTSLWPVGQWRILERQLGLFSKVESERAIRAYFEFYHISAELTSAAKEKLSHPLILRFFCEAYGDPNSAPTIKLQKIPDIRLKVLFAEYLRRKLDSICHTAPKRFRTPDSVKEFLFSLADRMRASRNRDVQRDDLPMVTRHQDLESPESVYISILGEDILLEEQPDPKTGRIRVGFTYDEFMEYVIALSMLRGIDVTDDAQIKLLFEECQNGAAAFPSFVGVLEYLAIILREDWQYPSWHNVAINDPKFGNAICRAIGKLGPEFVGEPEIRELGILTNSVLPQVRLPAVRRLTAIASSTDYERSSRTAAVELLGSLLTKDDNVTIRDEVLKCFENEKVSGVSSTARRIVNWWNERRTSVRKLPIVFSDDNEDYLFLVGELFKSSGWTNVFLIAEAFETIDVVAQVNPAIVVTDLSKPGMSGAEMARRLKASPVTSSIPIVLVTATEYVPEETYSTLFCASLSKPFDSNVLVRTIEIVLAGRYNDLIEGAQP